VITETLVATLGRVQDWLHKWQGICMIIELGNIHVKWKLLIEDTCMRVANDNVTVWIRTWFGVCGHVTNKGKLTIWEG
jgi:hypothetical protein